MNKYWSDFLVQFSAGLAVLAFVGIISYVRSEKFRKWFKGIIANIVAALRWWARHWKYNLVFFLIGLLEITIYFLLKNLIAVLLSLLHVLLITFIFKLFQNTPLLKNQETDWSDLLISRRWILIYRPPDQSKPISFLRNGEIGDGQNQNEHGWRIQNERLEILQLDGRVHSRFDFHKNENKFIHTNDPDTLSVRSQIIHLS
jgi:hypothetical protein